MTSDGQGYGEWQREQEQTQTEEEAADAEARAMADIQAEQAMEEELMENCHMTDNEIQAEVAMIHYEKEHI